MRAGSVSTSSCGPLHGTWLPPGGHGQDPRHRIDYSTAPLGQLPHATKQGVGIDLDLSMRCDDHFGFTRHVCAPYRTARASSHLDEVPT
eukprot:321644-Pyramimonas_sp.AAC.1